MLALNEIAHLLSTAGPGDGDGVGVDGIDGGGGGGGGGGGRGRVRVVTGYPNGPTNLPMSGQIRNKGRPCDEVCRHAYINKTRHRWYWFAHKAPAGWLALYRAWYPCLA